MTLETLGDVNWLAILVATIAYMMLGGFWYSPAGFAKPWMKASGVQMPEGETPGPGIYVVPAIAYLVASIATGMLAVATGSDTFGEGLVLGLVVGIGYAATLLLVTTTFDMKPDPRTFFLITGSFNVIALVLVGVLVSIWN